ncbi:uncharacterized protein LOC133731067 [Rosa rugosa]|uniref:uncharacterized protein LOC133731067 n=1 Tax=Rosa rugosa TaxID=74645 RepID=UPI002B40EFF1|nr:uncharacterized protein LOC133731067 [Rosa rugosa]
MVESACLQHHTSTTRTNRKPDWSQLPTDIYEVILSKLPLRSILRWKAVCHSCYNVTKDILETSTSFTWLAEAPWLLLYQDIDHDDLEDVDDDAGHDEGSLFEKIIEEEEGLSIDREDTLLRRKKKPFVFYNLEGIKFSKSKNSIPEELHHGAFLGSSQGWLLFLNKKLEFVLVNPLLSGTSQLSLPPLSDFPDIINITYDLDGPIITGTIRERHSYPAIRIFTSLEDFWKRFRTKVVVCPQPTCSSTSSSRSRNNIFGVMIMYCIVNNPRLAGEYNLAFCKTNGDLTWTKLDEHRGGYTDIMWNHNQLYALRSNRSTVTVWDFTNSIFPIYKTDIEADAGAIQRTVHHESYRTYIIKTVEGLLLVWRTWRTNSPDRFHAFKLDYSDGSCRWIEVESIGNIALILDSNESILISPHNAPGWDKNSIYFVRKLPNNARGYGLYVFSLHKKGSKKVKKKLHTNLPYGVTTPVFLG